MEKRLGFGASRPFNLEEELADEQLRLNTDDGSTDLDRMLPCGVTAEEACVMRQDHERRAAAAKRPRPRPQRKAAPPKTTADGLLTVASAAERLTTSPDHVLNLIRAGKIKAVNVGRGLKRPRWRIAPEALKQFTGGRETSTPKARTRRSKGGEVEFF